MLILNTEHWQTTPFPGTAHKVVATLFAAQFDVNRKTAVHLPSYSANHFAVNRVQRKKKHQRWQNHKTKTKAKLLQKFVRFESERIKKTIVRKIANLLFRLFQFKLFLSPASENNSVCEP